MIVLPELRVHIGRQRHFFICTISARMLHSWGLEGRVQPHSQVGFFRCIRVVNTILSVYFYPCCGLSNLLRSPCQVGHCSDYQRCTPSHPHPGWHCDCRPQRYLPLGKAILALVWVFVRRHFHRHRHYCRIGKAGCTHSNPMAKPYRHCPVQVRGCH